MPPPTNRKSADVAKSAQNEYIPNFISKKPFYVVDDSNETSASDYLEHQRLQTSGLEQGSQKWYDRGRKLGPAATKFRKGACENCGSMTHKTKECLSRPRKHGAKWTGQDIQADEVVQDVKMGWDAKRDRWNGYDASEYQNVVEEYNAFEELKKELKSGSTTDGTKLGDGAEAGGEVVDEAKYEEETDMGRQQSTSTRNLRLREDTAKYLLNLDLDSAKYDPKTRSMIDSGANADQAAALVAEEGFMRASGDAAEFEKAQKYAWEMQERGDKNRIHLQANPTSGEYYRKKEQQEKEVNREAHRKALLDKYGGQEHLDKNPLHDAAVVESERYVEYDERGLIKGAPTVKAKSQYPEDVFINNHTSVWGSWWKDFKWGYACCHSIVKNSYCTGEDGKRAQEELNPLDSTVDTEEVPKQIAWEEEAQEEKHVPNGVEADAKGTLDAKNRKRTLGQMKGQIDDEEVVEYRKRRIADDDPMRTHLGKDELVH